MKASVTISEREIVIEHRYSSFTADGAVATDESTLIDGLFAGLNLILDKKTTITVDKTGKSLTIREKGRLRKENTRLFKSEQLREIVVLVHTQKRTLRRDKKTATVQVASKRSSDNPILLFLNEPYHEAIAVVLQVSESLGLPIRERDVLSKG